MPELGEVAHAASLLRKYLLNQTIKAVDANVDEILFVKPLTNSVFKSTLNGQKITNVQRQGKYFWFEVNNSKTIVLHFGMTGWFHVRDVYTHFIAMENAGDKIQKKLIEEMGSKPTGPVIEDRPSESWPPKFVKFTLHLENGRELVFTDPRRLGRCRLFDVPASKVMELAPLSKLGWDFSQDQWNLEEFKERTAKRRVPSKAYLLDQTVFSGVGNWMADEILYQARIHPEQYCHTLEDNQMEELYSKLLDVCRIAVETEGNTAAFPDDWLMLHRWGKRRKTDPQVLPNGDKFEFVTVGGRTSCFVPRLQVLDGHEPRGAPTTPRKRAKKQVKKEIKQESESASEELTDFQPSESEDDIKQESESNDSDESVFSQPAPKRTRKRRS